MIHSKEFDAGYKAGMKIASVALGMSDNEMRASKAADTAIRNDVEAQQTICKIAKFILSNAGEKGMLYSIYDTLEKTASVAHQVTFDTYLSPVLESVAECDAARSLTKEAAGKGMMDKVKTLLGPISFGSEAWKTMMAAMALTGTAGGGLWWAMNRGPEEEDVETQLKRDQAEYYKRMASDIRHRVDMNERKNPKIKQVKNALEDAGYVL